MCFPTLSIFVKKKVYSSFTVGGDPYRRSQKKKRICHKESGKIMGIKSRGMLRSQEKIEGLREIKFKKLNQKFKNWKAPFGN